MEDLVQLTVRASNEAFSGVAQVYSTRRDLHSLADQLKGYPSSKPRDIEFRAEDPHLGSLCLRFFYRDSAHHVSLLVEMKRASQNPNRPSDRAAFVIDLEGAVAIDRFRNSLVQIGNKQLVHAQIAGVAL